MKRLLSPILVLMLSAAHAADSGLKCEEVQPRARSIRISRMEPVRRGDTWLEGSPKSARAQSCDLYGMKTEEAEYDGKALLAKSSFSYKEKDEAKDLCKKLRSEEKNGSTFNDEGRSPLDGFCRKNIKKDFGAVLVYDASPSQGKESDRKPVRQIFRLYNSKGFPVEEDAFDSMLNPETVTLYTYDKTNNLTETATNDFDGRQLKRETVAWSKATSSRTRIVFGENNELREKIVYELREDGTLRREVRSAYDSGEQVVTKSEIYCDEKGHYQKELVYDADSPEATYQYTYSYKYDAKGNWTEQRRARMLVYNGNLMPDKQSAPEITRRELVYY